MVASWDLVLGTNERVGASADEIGAANKTDDAAEKTVDAAIERVDAVEKIHQCANQEVQ